LYKNLQLTDRERIVLSLLLENKVMTRKQIVNSVFPKLDTGNVTHRLIRLLELGYLADYQDRRYERKAILYELTDEGVLLAKSFYEMEFDQRPSRSYTYEHDVGLVNLRKLFQEKKSVQRYITENILQCCPATRENDKFKSFSEMMCDAVIVIKLQDKFKIGALEYEPSVKKMERYRDKVLNYYVKSDISFVLYVCSNLAAIETIKSVENELKPNGATKMYFALYEDVLKSQDKLIFTNRNQFQFEII
jgi:hypothetical protein